MDQRCSYNFDVSNIPALGPAIPAGGVLSKIPLILDADADFYLRAVNIWSGFDTDTISTSLLVGLEDTSGNPLINPSSPGLPPVLLPSLWGETALPGWAADLESDTWGVYCPGSGGLYLYVQNPTAAPVSPPVIVLHGIKRYTGDQCR